ncbi:alpha/beta hydrolase-fold protein [Stenotrophomonas sp.]|uniref:alpha/beta hydrolase n=1 Tax=Stenotrophomonas sp. TaxID=69392 RepID=UPI002FC9115A
MWPAAAAQPTQAEPTAPGVTAATPLAIGETFTLASRALGETRRINVYRPTAWNLPADQPLPVLYMPDGGIGEDFLHVAGLVQVLVANGSMRPFLLVGIENTERRRDMTGPTQDPKDRTIAPRVGGAPAFRAFLRTELMPQVRQRHATTGETAIVGESLAGLFVLDTLVREPDLFDTYIALDPSLWWNRGQLLDEAVAQLKAADVRGKQVAIASGNDPKLAADAARFAQAVGAALPGIDVKQRAMPEETHLTLYHPAALWALRTLFKPVAAP